MRIIRDTWRPIREGGTRIPELGIHGINAHDHVKVAWWPIRKGGTRYQASEFTMLAMAQRREVENGLNEQWRMADECIDAAKVVVSPT